MENISISVVDYMGRLEFGVAVILSIKIGDETTEALYWYDNENRVLTLNEESMVIFGCSEIEDYEHYNYMMETILNMVVPFGEIYGDLKDFDFDIEYDEFNNSVEYVSESDISFGPTSSES